MPLSRENQFSGKPVFRKSENRDRRRPAATLVIMVKEPRPGRVKTRLAADIGPLPAALWMRRRLARLVQDLTTPHWTTCLAVAPDRALHSGLLPSAPRMPQGTGDLGHRMTRALKAAPRGPVLVIGADIPGITRAHVRDAFRQIARHGAVIGPARDGGYWAVGLDTRRPVPRDLFHGTRWSTEHALADTLATLPAPAFLPVLDDVDNVADLARLSD